MKQKQPPKPPITEETFRKRIADELCTCGDRKSDHQGNLHSGYCMFLSCKCERFTWAAFLDVNGERIERSPIAKPKETIDLRAKYDEELG